MKHPCSAKFGDGNLESNNGDVEWPFAQAYWDGLIDYERRAARPEDLKLARMRRLLDGLGNPHRFLRTVHVAGTKGKGSCCALLESVFRSAGWKTGLFVSPHIQHLTERFVINGRPVAVQDLARAILRVKYAAERFLGEIPTFFEVATAAAFLCFQSAKVDWVVLETGLGGRLDSTNVCFPTATLITGVGLDHVQILGNTLEEIAYEKAGIIKPGVPVVSGVMEDGPRAVVRGMAGKQAAPLWELGEQIQVDFASGISFDPWRETVCSVRTPLARYENIRVSLVGNHQGRNASLVLGVLDQLRLRGLGISEEAVHHGLEKVDWPGRLQTISRNPWILLDAAHNVPSVRALVEMLRNWPVRGTRKLLFSVSKDKDVEGILALLAPLFDEIHLTRYTVGIRAMAQEEMAGILIQSKQSFDRWKLCKHDTPQMALGAILPGLASEDGLCIAGSIFLLGEVKPVLEQWISA